MQSDSFFAFQSAHVLITGASGGIGLVLAQNYLNHGCRVTLQYNQNRSPLEALEEKYLKLVYIHSADMRDEASVVGLFEKAKGKFGFINILIANHGIEESEDVPIWQMSLKQWNNTIDVNLTGVFLACREYLKGVKQTLDATPDNNDLKNLSIILIASTAALFGEAYHSDYAASKSALFGFMKSLKNEIVKIHERLRINCVAPGWVRTPMAEKVCKHILFLCYLFIELFDNAV